MMHDRQEVKGRKEEAAVHHLWTQLPGHQGQG